MNIDQTARLWEGNGRIAKMDGNEEIPCIVMGQSVATRWNRREVVSFAVGFVIGCALGCVFYASQSLDTPAIQPDSVTHRWALMTTDPSTERGRTIIYTMTTGLTRYESAVLPSRLKQMRRLTSKRLPITRKIILQNYASASWCLTNTEHINSVHWFIKTTDHTYDIFGIKDPFLFDYKPQNATLVTLRKSGQLDYSMLRSIFIKSKADFLKLVELQYGDIKLYATGYLPSAKLRHNAGPIKLL